MLNIQDITYMHPNKDVLFSGISLTVNKQNKIALTGNNGVGKSVMLQLLAGKLVPTLGIITTSSQPYYVPQLTNKYDACTVAQSLGLDKKLNALHKIIAGNGNEDDYIVLDDDWSLEERINEAFNYWSLGSIKPNDIMENLSGGQKTKAFLAGIQIYKPEIVLLDEPSNHLDAEGRKLLYDYIVTTKNTLVVVSHDRTLLNLLNTVCELSPKGLKTYGGNYEFYKQQKQIETEALNYNIQNREKELRKARETERETIERQNKLDARGKKKQEKAGLPTIAMKTFKNNAEKSTARVKDVHTEKIGSITESLNLLRLDVNGIDKIKLDLDNSMLHKGKELIIAKGINFSYNGNSLWDNSLSFMINSGERIVIKGANGKGKTTLIKIILGVVNPTRGQISDLTIPSVYIDQDYSLINDNLSVYEQAQSFNTGILQEHDIKMRLNRFLFSQEYWDKSCAVLSGGEKMRLLLCCITISNQAPDLIILDEPTNNLDLVNITILTNAIKEYKGTLIVVSHDTVFLEEIGVEREIILQ